MHRISLIVAVCSILIPFIPSHMSAIAEASSSNVIEPGSQAPLPRSSDLEELLLFFEEEDLIVAATKSPRKVKDAPAVATVITAEEIRNMGARDILDVIKRIPGMGIARGVESAQGLWSIESRGIMSFASEKIRFMIDGHNVSNVFNGGGTHLFSDLSVENIKRIEVIRGPGSALHGTNAFVAVINVVTKDAEDINGFDIRAGVGSYDSRHYNLLYGKDHSGWKVVSSLDYLTTDGTEERVGSDVLGNSGDVDDRKEKYDLGLKISKRGFYWTNRYITIDRGPYIGVGGALNDDSDIELSHFFTEAGYKDSVAEDMTVTIKGYYDRFRFDQWFEILPEGSTLTIPGGPTYYYPDGMIGDPALLNTTVGGEIQTDYSVSDKNSLTFGLQYEFHDQSNVTSTANFHPDTYEPLDSVQDITSWGNFNKDANRTVYAVYLQDIWQFAEKTEATFGIRYDHYSDFGETINPRLGLVRGLTEKATLKLLYGSAFRAPTFQELYNTHNPVANGNEDLEPERIKTYEAEFGYRVNENAHLNLSYFHNDIKDLISLVSESTKYVNVGEAVVNGIEAELRVNLNKMSGYINYTYQDARDPDSGDKLAGIAQHKGNIGFNMPLSYYLNLNSNLLCVGPRARSEDDARSDLDGYEVLDATLIAKRFIKGLEVRFSAYNLLNEEYEDADTKMEVRDDYPRERGSYMVEARYQF